MGCLRLSLLVIGLLAYVVVHAEGFVMRKGKHSKDGFHMVDPMTHLKIRGLHHPRHWFSSEESVQNFFAQNSDDILKTLLNAAPKSGSVLYLGESERPFELHWNETGTLTSGNVTGNYTDNSFTDYHVDTAAHGGHMYSVGVKTIMMPNTSVHYEVKRTFGRFLMLNITLEWMKESHVDILRKDSPSTVTLVGNSTVQIAGEMNSTGKGKMVFETFHFGHDNMTNHLSIWVEQRNGTRSFDSGVMNSTSSGNGTARVVQRSEEDSFILAGSYLGARRVPEGVLENGSNYVNFTDCVSAQLKFMSGASPFSANATEVLDFGNKSYTMSDVATGFIWRTPAMEMSEGDDADLNIMNILDLLI